MTTLDTRLRDAALRLITKYGRTVRFKVFTGTYVPSTRTRTRVATEKTAKSTPPFAFDQSWSSTMLSLGDMYVLVAAKNLTFTPEPGIEFIDLDLKVWTCDGVEIISSGEEVAVYVLKLKR